MTCSFCEADRTNVSRVQSICPQARGMSPGVGFVAICSNDAASHPEDSFGNMKNFAKTHNFPFPYLHDETQAAARAYGAV
nr:redoxin domain-containing protein [Nitrobacter vulgaris]